MEPKEHPSRTLPKKGDWENAQIIFLLCAHAASKKEGQAPPKFPDYLNSEFSLPSYFAFNPFFWHSTFSGFYRSQSA